MKPFWIGNDQWQVIEVDPEDPNLIDRLGHKCLGTTDGEAKVIYLSSGLEFPKLDKVLIHEIAHAMTISHGLLDILHAFVAEESWVFVEEWAANFVEDYGLKVSNIASLLLERPVCVDGDCLCRPIDICFAACPM
jgi:hypothetical protein